MACRKPLKALSVSKHICALHLLLRAHKSSRCWRRVAQARHRAAAKWCGRAAAEVMAQAGEDRSGRKCRRKLSVAAKRTGGRQPQNTSTTAATPRRRAGNIFHHCYGLHCCAPALLHLPPPLVCTCSAGWDRGRRMVHLLLTLLYLYIECSSVSGHSVVWRADVFSGRREYRTGSNLDAYGRQNAIERRWRWRNDA